MAVLWKRSLLLLVFHVKHSRATRFDVSRETFISSFKIETTVLSAESGKRDASVGAAPDFSWG
jgi:hypothetical protein